MKTVIEMARQSGIVNAEYFKKALEDFAALVREEVYKDDVMTDAYMAGFAAGRDTGQEETKEKAVKVCDDLYKHDRKESGYDEGWNDALGTAENAIRSMK